MAFVSSLNLTSLKQKHSFLCTAVIHEAIRSSFCSQWSQIVDFGEASCSSIVQACKVLKSLNHQIVCSGIHFATSKGTRGFLITPDTSWWALHTIQGALLHHQLAEILLLCSTMPEIKPQQQVW
jgi:hypothetical protein